MRHDCTAGAACARCARSPRVPARASRFSKSRAEMESGCDGGPVLQHWRAVSVRYPLRKHRTGQGWIITADAKARNHGMAWSSASRAADRPGAHSGRGPAHGKPRLPIARWPWRSPQRRRREARSRWSTSDPVKWSSGRTTRRTGRVGEQLACETRRSAPTHRSEADLHRLRHRVQVRGQGPHQRARRPRSEHPLIIAALVAAGLPEE